MSESVIPRPVNLSPASAAGDRDAFLALVRQLVHGHRTQLAQVARREGLTPEDAFDAVQEAFHTFLTLPQARSLVQTPEEARKLLVVLTRNVARNARRLHAHARPHVSDAEVVEGLPDGTADVEAVLAAAEDHVRLAGCVRTLAQVQRTVVTLRMLDDLPGEEVARSMGITPGHVAVLLHRAKGQLLACMTGRPT